MGVAKVLSVLHPQSLDVLQSGHQTGQKFQSKTHFHGDSCPLYHGAGLPAGGSPAAWKPPSFFSDQPSFLANQVQAFPQAQPASLDWQPVLEDLLYYYPKHLRDQPVSTKEQKAWPYFAAREVFLARGASEILLAVDEVLAGKRRPELLSKLKVFLNQVRLLDFEQSSKKEAVVWQRLITLREDHQSFLLDFRDHLAALESLLEEASAVQREGAYDLLVSEALDLQAHWTAPWLWEALLHRSERDLSDLEAKVEDLHMDGKAVPAVLANQLASQEGQLADLQQTKARLETLAFAEAKDFFVLAELLTKLQAHTDSWLFGQLDENLSALARLDFSRERFYELADRFEVLKESPQALAEDWLELVAAMDYHQNLGILEVLQEQNKLRGNLATYQETWRHWAWGTGVPQNLEALQAWALVQGLRQQAKFVAAQEKEALDESGELNTAFLAWVQEGSAQDFQAVPALLSDYRQQLLAIADLAEAGDVVAATQQLTSLERRPDILKAKALWHRSQEDDAAWEVPINAGALLVGFGAARLLQGLSRGAALHWVSSLRGGLALEQTTVLGSRLHRGLRSLGTWAAVQTPRVAGAWGWGMGFYTVEHGINSWRQDKSFSPETYDINQKAEQVLVGSGLASGIYLSVEGINLVLKRLPGPLKFVAALGVLTVYGSFSQELSHQFKKHREGGDWDPSWASVQERWQDNLGQSDFWLGQTMTVAALALVSRLAPSVTAYLQNKLEASRTSTAPLSARGNSLALWLPVPGGPLMAAGNILSWAARIKAKGDKSNAQGGESPTAGKSLGKIPLKKVPSPQANVPTNVPKPRARPATGSMPIRPPRDSRPSMGGLGSRLFLVELQELWGQLRLAYRRDLRVLRQELRNWEAKARKFGDSVPHNILQKMSQLQIKVVEMERKIANVQDLGKELSSGTTPIPSRLRAIHGELIDLAQQGGFDYLAGQFLAARGLPEK